MGIHYDYKSTRGAKAMEKQAKREKKLAEKRAKKLAKAQEKGLIQKINKKEDPGNRIHKEKQQTKKTKKRPPKPKPIKEPLYIYNAGLVLLWPYIGRLFTMLKYTKEK